MLFEWLLVEKRKISIEIIICLSWFHLQGQVRTILFEFSDLKPRLNLSFFWNNSND